MMIWESGRSISVKRVRVTRRSVIRRLQRMKAIEQTFAGSMTPQLTNKGVPTEAALTICY